MDVRKFSVFVFYLFVFVSTASFAAECAPFYCSFDCYQSIYNCNGIITGELEFVPGVNGKAASFDGLSDVNFVGELFDVPQGSISLWFKKNSNAKCGGIWQIGSLGQKNSMGLFYDWYNSIYFEIKNENWDFNQINALNSISDYNDTHIVCTWEQRENSNFIKLFVNGKTSPDVNWAELPGEFVHDENPLVIGRDDYHGNGEGIVDEVRFFNWPLSDAEVYAEYVYSSNSYKRQPTGKEVSEGTIKIVNNILMANDEPFIIKGVGYQPTPIGMEPTRDTLDYIYTDPNIIARDLPYLKKMNVNTIRFWAELPNDTSLLDALEQAGIYAILAFEVPASRDDPNIDYSDPNTITYYKDKMTDYVNQFKNHPAVLAWAIGNENNLHYDGNVVDWYKLANELAQVAYEAEEPNYHPTMVINGHMLYFGDVNYRSDDANMNYVDIWGHNAYTYYDYHSYFCYYKKISAKPLVITEFGADAYDNRHHCEYQGVQAEWAVHEWVQIKNNSLGGTVMAYSDEWWKKGFPHCQDTLGFDTDTQPDRFSNEEWYGIMAIEDNGDLPDIMHPRENYCALLQAFGGTMLPGDFDLDCDVDFNDLALFTKQWLAPRLPANIAPIPPDCIVNFLDWATFANAWQTIPSSQNWNPDCDFGPSGGDGKVNWYDVGVFAEQWLQFYYADIFPDRGDGTVDLRDFAILAKSWLEDP